MTKREIGQEILDGLKEIKAHKNGNGKKLVTRKLKDPSSAKVIRDKLELSQDAFASLMGVSIRTVQDWEQGRREPCLLYTSPSPRDKRQSRMPSSA